MEVVRFGELYEIPSSNGVSRPSAVRGEGYKMVNMGELFSNDIILDIPMERVFLSEKEKQKFLLEEDDLLFARQSLVASGAGKCSIVKELKEETTFESHLIRVRLNKKIANPWFYYYLFRLPTNPVKTIVNQCAQAGIRGAELVKVKVPCPSIEIQNKIVDLLKSYDELIIKNQKEMVMLEDILQTLYKEWFVHFRFPGYEKVDFHEGVPTIWNYEKIGDIMTFDRGISYSSEEIDCDEGLNLINLKNIQSFGGFRRDGTKKYNGKYKNSQVVKENDLIMGVTDMTQERRTVGSVALIPDIEGISVISADLVKVNSHIDNVFLYTMFRFGNISKYLSQFGNGANVIHLKPDTIKNKKILMPDEETLKAFTDKIRPIITQLNNLNNQNDNLIEQRDLLLPRLMSGKLSV